MQALKKFQVSTSLPDKLSPLLDIAYNYWWCWESEGWELFRRIDNRLFESVNHNPVQLLNLTNQSRLKELAESEEYVAFLNRVHGDFKNYMAQVKWWQKQYKDIGGSIAYFSPEYGINESFPNYSGGLGVLSGDHVKSASDLGLPMVAIGLLYQEGYFRQHIMENGWQTEKYINNDFYNMPLRQLKDEDGNILKFELDYPKSKLYFSVWELYAGTTRLFLLDTNIEENKHDDYRRITTRLYGGDREMRIQQEYLLGIGGAKTLKHLDIECSCFHINEGHAAFALLERTAQFMKSHELNFWEACQITKTSTVFTTHTPVPAGNEAFELQLVEKYLMSYMQNLGVNREEFLSLGHINGFNEEEYFSMTVLGLRFSTYHNGVSKLHGAVSRAMWRGIWNTLPVDEVPIGHVTNGIHTKTFVAPELAKLFDRYIGTDWKTNTDKRTIWERAKQIPDEELWNEKQRLRMQLIRLVRERIKHAKHRPVLVDSEAIEGILNPEALTIGFARRFATYKRADLIFRDMDRLEAILKGTDRPVQILIAGKAHPHDTMGKETIQRIIKKVKQRKLERNVIFIDDYDMVIARALVRGCDVWLNNPIRPLEASGTSGMKSALNGGLNLSILDGWWDEGYNGNNGFAIGEGDEYEEPEKMAEIESNMIYDLLESRVVPLFFERKSYGIPRRWIGMMKEAIATLAPAFSTHRMVKDYTREYYSKAMKAYHNMYSDAEKPKSLYAWINDISGKWGGVEFERVEMDLKTNNIIGDKIGVECDINLGEIDKDSVKVEIYHGRLGIDGDIEAAAITPLECDESQDGKSKWSGHFFLSDSGMHGATVRIMPYHPLLNEPFQLYKCKWANRPEDGDPDGQRKLNL